MRFSSHETVQEKRTSLNITPGTSLCCHGGVDISFDLRFMPLMEIYFGYIFRLITDERQNIDLVYNQRLKTFNLIAGETPSGTFSIDSPRLYTDWTRLELRLDKDGRSIAMYMGKSLVGRARVPARRDWCFKMSFGTSALEEFQTADIPPMCMKNLQIREEGRVKYYWPLSDTAGTECRDSLGRRRAVVNNPIWLRTRHQRWQPALSLQVKGTPGVAFDPDRDILYVTAADSLYEWSVQKREYRGIPLAKTDAVLPPGNQSITHAGRLYNFYIDQKKVRTYDFEQRKWNDSFKVCPLTEFWHANKFIGKDSSLYILGGYGQLQYKNLVQRYSFRDRDWTTIHPQGDFFAPRYLAALGLTNDTAYIMGGYGSHTGNQVVNPKYHYDLLSYNVRDHSFKTIYQLSEPSQPFCFANSLVIPPGSGEYYGLIFPNTQFNSYLQLIRGSLSSPGLEPVGDSIPYTFYDVKSFADLYYAPLSQQLLAVTLFTNKEDITEVRVYTIAFPPNPAATGTAAVSSWSWHIILWLIPLIALGILARVATRRRITRVSLPVGASFTGAVGLASSSPVTTGADNSLEETAAVPLPAPRSSILFFGQFEVYDKEGHELTRLFTPLLKEMFLLISIHSLRSGRGISSEKLYATLWSGKSSKDAQNNRSVNMVKLKGILDKLGPCSIGKEGDKWIFRYSETQIDLAEFLDLVQISHPGKADVQQVLVMLHRGGFLSDTVYPWLDDIQSEISGKAIDFLSAASTSFSGDPEFLLDIAAGIFLFDPVNEEALRVKCRSLSLLGRHSLAKAAYEKFAKEYHLMYGEEFKVSFQEVLADEIP